MFFISKYVKHDTLCDSNLQAYFTSYISKLNIAAEERARQHAQVVEQLTIEATNYRQVS